MTEIESIRYTIRQWTIMKEAKLWKSCERSIIKLKEAAVKRMMESEEIELPANCFLCKYAIGKWGGGCSACPMYGHWGNGSTTLPDVL